MSQKPYKSWGLWLALAALIVFCVLQFTGVNLGPQLGIFMNLLLPVLVALGIVNNPTNPTGLGEIDLSTAINSVAQAVQPIQTVDPAADPAAPRPPDSTTGTTT